LPNEAICLSVILTILREKSVVTLVKNAEDRLF